MFRARLLITVVVAIVALLAPAGPVTAAELVDVAGTVRATDGSAAAGVEVIVSVAGSDIVAPATTDSNGAFATRLEASIGDTLEVRATGATVSTGPDDEGCVRSSTPTGRTSLVIEALPLEPVDVALNSVIETETCAETARPDLTPPSTDSAEAAEVARPGAGIGLLLGLTWLIAAGSILTVRRRS